MELNEHWKRALTDVLACAHYGDVELVDVWSAVTNEMPPEYSHDSDTLMKNTLELLKYCLEEGYLVAGETYPLVPLTAGARTDEPAEQQPPSDKPHRPKPKVAWRPWDMGYSEALKKIEEEWRAIEKPFEDVTAMYGIVTLMPTLQALREYERLREEVRLDEEADDD
jgi:hypothetical protein